MALVHLRVHSYYSFLRGVNSPQELCRAAAEAGMGYLALTDHNGLYGLVPFLEGARRHKVRPIVGAFLTTATEQAVVLAKTPSGYERLCELISARHLRADFSLARAFPPGRDHLAVISADPALLRALRRRADCWVKVVPGREGRRALGLAHQLELPPVAVNPVYFVDPVDHDLHRLVRAIDCNRTLSTLEEAETVSRESWFKPEERVVSHFPHCPQALANTLKLARRCHTGWDLSATVFPRYQDSDRDHFSLLLDRCRAGIRWRYRHSNAAIERRLVEELELIREKGYVDYFLVVADIVSRRPLHCGRGSAAASLVSYLLGITHVDPIAHRLVFGRFLNPQRRDHPDIDVDFPWDERDRLLREIEGEYGSRRFAMVANHIGFGARAAVRETAKVYGMPPDQIKEVSRRLSGWTRPARLWERVERHPKFARFPLDPPWPAIFDLAARLENLPRHPAVHCGGIILAPERITRHVPVQRSRKGVRIIQWEKDQSEAAGLVKIDLLGNRSLAVIRDALRAVERNTGRRIDYANFNPLHDPATLKLLGRGDTMGVFYVESPAMRQLQRKTGRGDFEHLVIHSSIIRPAANRYIQEYIRRLHGASYQPLHPALEELLAETYGILVYQEQVIQAAMLLAGFDWAEADGLRKVLSKKSRQQVDDYRRRFHQGCTRRGVSEEVQRAVWDMFTSFAGYSFCKPHSASYALVSFKSAYLKAHYPAEFMAAVVSNGGGYYTPFAYLSEARRMGLTVLGVDVNASAWSYRGKGRTLRVGFQQLREVREETLQALVEERRRNGPYRSLGDWFRRLRPTPADAVILAKSGALDSLAGGLNRAQLLWWVRARLQATAVASGPGRSPAAVSAACERFLPAVPRLQEISPEKRLRQEMESLGLLFSVHPAACYRKHLERSRRLPETVIASELERWVGRTVWVLGWPVTRKEILTREGDAMEFVSFEDETAIYEAVFFPEVFNRFCQRLDMGRGYLLRAAVEKDHGAVNLVVRDLKPLPPVPGVAGWMGRADGDDSKVPAAPEHLGPAVAAIEREPWSGPLMPWRSRGKVAPISDKSW